MIKTVKRLIRLSVNSILNPFNIEFREIKPHERNWLKWLTEFEVKTIIDVGANTGQFAQEFHKLFPEAQMYSFEPLLDVYTMLKHNCLDMEHFSAFNFALGDFNGKTPINRSSFSPSSSLLAMSTLHKTAFPATSGNTVETIEVRKLDDLVSEKIVFITPETLIKIDVQGFEDKVIAGGSATLLQSKIVIIETSYVELYEGQPLFNDIYRMLTDLGYIYRGSIDVGGYLPGNALPLYSDSVFVRN